MFKWSIQTDNIQFLDETNSHQAPNLTEATTTKTLKNGIWFKFSQLKLSGFYCVLHDHGSNYDWMQAVLHLHLGEYA